MLTPQALRRSTRKKRKPDHLKKFACFSIVDVPATCLGAFGVDPYSYKIAMNGPESEMWQDAMNKEYSTIMDNNTWILVDPPPEVSQYIVGCKWVHKRKPHQNGQLYKARLVAKGYSQVKGVNYEETFAPVVRLSTIRLLFAIAAVYDLEVMHYDVNSAFLQRKLHQKVYMYQPEGFNFPNKKSKVCLLVKPIYGLKQGGFEWNQELSHELKSMGFNECEKD